MRHGSHRLDRVRGRYRNRRSERKHHTTETSTRRGSGVLTGRCALYSPHSTPLLPPDGIVSTELVNSPGIQNLLPNLDATAVNSSPTSSLRASEVERHFHRGSFYAARPAD